MLSLVLVCALSGAQAEGARIPDELRALENLAIAAEPALGADVWLRLAEIASDPAWKRELLEGAFSLGNGALTEYPTVPVPVGFTDSVAAMSAIASRLQVDRLSLRLRAVRAMLLREPGRAREMFEAVSRPSPPASSCKDLAVPEVGQYHTTLRAVAEQAFSAAEIQKGDQLRFLQRFLFPISSPSQVFPATGVLAEVKIPRGSFELLMSALAASIGDLEGDDRAFTIALLGEERGNQARAIVRRCEENGISPAPTLSALRRFYAKHLSGARCADTGTSEPLRQRQSSGLEQFSGIAKRYLSGNGELILTPLEAEYQPADAAVDFWKENADYRKLLAEFAELGEGKSAKTFSDVAAAVDSWRGAVPAGWCCGRDGGDQERGADVCQVSGVRGGGPEGAHR